MRLLVTGTDTDVGKTRVTARVAATLRAAGRAPTIVKLVQTGVANDAPGDAQWAGSAAGCAYSESARFQRATDPWSAALAEDKPPPTVAGLCASLPARPRSVVAEGSGGLAVPLNAHETFVDFARAARLDVIVTVGLRLGCINHALLTLLACSQAGVSVVGAVLVDRWNLRDPEYHRDVVRILGGKTRIVDELSYNAVDPPIDERSTYRLRSMLELN